jgi:hypothetical protein
MLKNFRDRLALSGIIVLAIGVALLIFTFVSAYGFLTASLSIITSQDLASTFGNALAPLIGTCIHIMYLGIMGWAGSLITIRGVTIITHTPQPPPTVPQKPTVVEREPQPEPEPEKVEKPREEKTKEAPKPQEPQVIAIPPRTVTQLQSPQNSQNKNPSSPQAGNS